MGNTCVPVVNSCWCMAKPIQYCEVINFQLNKFILKKLEAGYYIGNSVYAKSLQSCKAFCDSMDCRLLGSFVHGILQARVLEWVPISSSRRSSWPRDQTCISCIAGRFFTTEPPGKHKGWLYYVLNSVAGCLLLKEYIHCKINFFMPPLFRKHFGWLGACCESFLLLTLDVVPLRSLEAELRIQ